MKRNNRHVAILKGRSAFNCRLAILKNSVNKIKTRTAVRKSAVKKAVCD